MKVTVWIATADKADTDASGLGVETSAFASYEAALAYVEKEAAQEYEDAVGTKPTEGGYEDWFSAAVDQDIFIPQWSITHHDLDIIELIEAQKLTGTAHSATGEAASGGGQEAA